MAKQNPDLFEVHFHPDRPKGPKPPIPPRPSWARPPIPNRPDSNEGQGQGQGQGQPPLGSQPQQDPPASPIPQRRVLDEPDRDTGQEPQQISRSPNRQRARMLMRSTGRWDSYEVETGSGLERQQEKPRSQSIQIMAGVSKSPKREIPEVRVIPAGEEKSRPRISRVWTPMKNFFGRRNEVPIHEEGVLKEGKVKFMEYAPNAHRGEYGLDPYWKESHMFLLENISEQTMELKIISPKRQYENEERVCFHGMLLKVSNSTYPCTLIMMTDNKSFLIKVSDESVRTSWFETLTEAKEMEGRSISVRRLFQN